MNTKIVKGMDALVALKGEHGTTGQSVAAACACEYFPMDSFSLVALDRSLHHLSGFIDLLERNNGQCAVIVLRAQLDTLLRYWAYTLFPDPHAFAMKVFSGVPVRKMEDPDLSETSRKGKQPKLDDRYLKTKFGQLHSWIPELYDGCCSFAHFSDQHCWEFVRRCGNVDAESGERDIAISIKDKLDEEDRKKLIDAFRSVTRLLLTQINVWSTNRVVPADTSLYSVFKQEGTV